MFDDTHTGARHFCAVLDRLAPGRPPRRVLAAGCGEGHEAAWIHRRLGGELVGIDPNLPEAAKQHREEGLTLMEASALEMPFPDGHFDAVFYHHVIEHVPDAPASLAEIARVLEPGGWLYVGTPNRHRIVGYVGSHDATLAQKVRWNVVDYRARLRGRFRNELGAHAGYSERELRRALERHFEDLRSLTADYLRFKYGERVPGPLVALAADTPLREVAAPAVYALGRRRAEP
jgi:ubiquinone/menaquinone biosynthesis C-methylase UbiE